MSVTQEKYIYCALAVVFSILTLMITRYIPLNSAISTLISLLILHYLLYRGVYKHSKVNIIVEILAFTYIYLVLGDIFIFNVFL